MIKNKLFACLILILLASGCSPKPVTAEITPAFNMVWVGDENQPIRQIAMQTALMISEGGQIETHLTMHTLIDSAYTIAAGTVPAQVKKSLSANEADLVVLQAFSLGQTIEEETFQTYAADWISFFETQGIKLIVFYPGRGIDQEVESYQEMVRMVLQLAWAKQLTLAPVGDVWQLLANQGSSVSLFAASNSRPSAAGVYLNSAVFYSIFTGKSPITHPVKLSIGSEQPDTIIRLDEESLQEIQEAAWQIMQTYQNQGEFTVFYELSLTE